MREEETQGGKAVWRGKEPMPCEEGWKGQCGWGLAEEEGSVTDLSRASGSVPYVSRDLLGGWCADW